MDVQLLREYSSLAATVVAFLLLCYCLLNWKIISSAKKIHPPQPSGSWPIIGHLHLLGDLPHISLGKLADKYGPVFMIKLGVNRALVVSSHETVKQCLGSNGKVFVDRPQTVFVKHLAYNSAMMGFSPYNQYWREMRKITTAELLSTHRVEMFNHVRVSEVRSALKDVYESYCVGENNSKPVEMRQCFNDISMNFMVRLIAGKPLKEFFHAEEFTRISKAFRDFFELGGTFVPADALPFLGWFDIGGYEKAMKKVAVEIDRVAQGWLDEHKGRRGLAQANGKQDFMDVMLQILESGLDVPTKFDADTINKAACMGIIAAATDTTAVTLTWALSLLLNNREAMKKAQAEIETHVGKERQVDESDLKNLIYLEAVLKETLRLYPAGPLSLPREAIQDCTVSGYHIPAGTQLFVNLYKMHRDPEVWPNPLEFHPERFLTTHKDYDVRGQNFAFLPFGGGRRICPGISFAIQSMMLTLASFLHGFDLSTPSDEAVDMTEGFGLTNLKATPLQVLFTPRLADNLYK